MYNYYMASNTKYDHDAVERKWQERWDVSGLYRVEQSVVPDNKLYVLPQLPYPSGSGLHVGHAEGYTACDIYARAKRMQGKDVLQVIGWDAFGLPAENFAIKNNIHPRIKTDESIDNFRYQIKRMGISVDWSREVGSHMPSYYKWTQWFFLLMYERGLAYRKKQRVNWCDSCKTVLANEQVVDGNCERCETVVDQREMEQWYLRITEYADRLYDDLDKVDWPKSTVLNQRNWIGRQLGANITFKLSAENDLKVRKLVAFTTRPDTLYGVTFLAVAPELVQTWIDSGWNAPAKVVRYVQKSLKKTDLERQKDEKCKSGVESGLEVVHPLTGEKLPVWVADYVLGSYGTGVVMGVPAHDARDYDFADAYDLKIVRVVVKDDYYYSCLVGGEQISDADLLALGIEIVERGTDGGRNLVIPKSSISNYQKLIKSKLEPGYWNEVVGSTIEFVFKPIDGTECICLCLEESTEMQIKHLCAQYAKSDEVLGASIYRYLSNNTFYKDLLLYAGEGVLIHSDSWNGWSVPDTVEKIIEDLIKRGVGERAKTFRLRDWSVSRQRFWGAPIPMVYDESDKLHPVEVSDLPVLLPDDVDFMPTGQSPLAYSENFQEGVEEKYGRGWRREVDTLDTFMCSSWYFFRYIDPHNEDAFASKEALANWMPVDFYIGGTEHTNGHLLYSRFFTKVLYDAGYITFDEPFLFHRHQGLILGEDNRKMSKRWGNVINPTEVMDRHGADVMRIYEMFMGPLSATKSWSTRGEVGIYRFIQRIWSLHVKVHDGYESEEQEKLINELVKKATEDIEELSFNTTIAKFMEFVNFMMKEDMISVRVWERFVILLAPYAPHLAEELWEILGKTASVHKAVWPTWNEDLLKQKQLNIVLQVNGKVRGDIVVDRDISDAKLEELAVGSEVVQKWIAGKQVMKVIVVPERLVNVVVGK